MAKEKDRIVNDGKQSAMFVMKNPRKSLGSAGGNLTFCPQLPPADVFKQQ